MSGATRQADEEGPLDDPLKKHYGRQAIRRSFRHFLVGKGIKTFASLATLLILARWLEATEYAVYIALRALVEVARVVTAVGATAVLYRYLPELRASGNNRAAYRLLGYGMGIRIAAIAVVFLAAVVYLPQLGIVFNLSDWLWLIPWYLLVGALDFSAHTLSQSLESYLWQKEAQLSLAAGNFVHMILLVLLVYHDGLVLPAAVFAEGAGLCVAMSLLLYGLYGRWRSDEQRGDGDLRWLRDNRFRMIRFGAWTFGLNLSKVLYGSGPNRLIVAHYLPAGDLATFGFAGNLANMGRRMMPSRLMSTMIRPLLLARFSVSGDFARLVHMTNLVYRINFSLLVLPIGMLLLGGESVIEWLTDGKYGAAAPLLAGFFVVLVVQGMRSILELVIQAVEKNHILAGSNLVLSASLFLSIPLIGIIGPWAILVANFCGTVIANLVIVVSLRRHGHLFSISWGPVFRIALYGGVAALIAWGVARVLMWDLIGLVLFPAIYGLLYWLRPPFSEEERRIVTSVLKKPRGKRRPDRSGEGAPRTTVPGVGTDTAEEKP